MSVKFLIVIPPMTVSPPKKMLTTAMSSSHALYWLSFPAWKKTMAYLVKKDNQYLYV